jgi:CHASE3 domain sensor protein
MKFKRIILSDLVFFLIIVLLTILSIFSYTRIITLNRQSNYITQADLVKLKLEQVLSYVKDAESGQRGFIITKDSIHLEAYYGAISKHKEIFNDIDSLIDKSDTTQRRRFSLMQWLVSKRLTRLGTVLDRDHLQTAETGELLNEGKIVMDQLKNLVAEMIREEDLSLKDHTKQKNYSAFITPLYSLVFISVCHHCCGTQLHFFKNRNAVAFSCAGQY